MSLASRIKAETPKLRPSFTNWLHALDPADREALEQAGRNPAWSNAAIVRLIVDEGGSASKDSIASWRAGLK